MLSIFKKKTKTEDKGENKSPPKPAPHDHETWMREKNLSHYLEGRLSLPFKDGVLNEIEGDGLSDVIKPENLKEVDISGKFYITLPHSAEKIACVHIREEENAANIIKQYKDLKDVIPLLTDPPRQIRVSFQELAIGKEPQDVSFLFDDMAKKGKPVAVNLRLSELFQPKLLNIIKKQNNEIVALKAAQPKPER
ncbi:MAG: hypothetical protein K9G62_08215 [Alphaproteobacteria bacterium]|nr:hypothetical protein [Alphaproteobacteria bacterium]